MKISILAGVVGGLLLAVTSTVQAAGDPVLGKSKNSMCAGCHGIEGYRNAYPQVYHVPKLGGQHAEYLVKALQAYKTGARSNTTMQGIASSLSDQDMADLAAYYTAAAK